MANIQINFKNIVQELENKELKLCFIKDRDMFIEDIQGNLYQKETYWVGSYLDRLIKDGITVLFNLVDSTKSKNIGDWEKEIWDVSDVLDFMKRQRITE